MDSTGQALGSVLWWNVARETRGTMDEGGSTKQHAFQCCLQTQFAQRPLMKAIYLNRVIDDQL
jgi:hypothetical protein